MILCSSPVDIKMEDIVEMTKNYLTKYQVEDVVNDEAVILFILESPHTQEVKYGYPVAGSSGLEMTRFIYNREAEDAFGKIVSQPEKYGDEYDDLEKFSLLNVSPSPMQAGGLKAYDLTVEDKKVVRILEKLRVNYKTKQHRNQEWNQVKEILQDNFKKRLLKALDGLSKLKYLVPCGKLAATYLNLIKDDEELIIKKEIISDIPHPSFNQWNHYDSMEKLKEKLEEIHI
jgi:hypothetical protein